MARLNLITGAMTSAVLLQVSGTCLAVPDGAVTSAAPAPEDRVNINEFDVVGNTVLSTRAVEAAVYPFVGPDRKKSDVEAARLALEKAYQAEGYQTVAVEIPEQQVVGGVVRLAVVENRVGRLNVTGARYVLPSEIKQAAPSLAEGQVPKFGDVQRDIVALNSLPDRKVTPTLKQGVDPNTVDVDLRVEDALPVHGSLEVNNQYSQDTKPYRMLASFSYGNLWQRGHTIGLSYLVAPQSRDNTEVYSAYYSAPLGEHSPWTLQLSGVKSSSNVVTAGSGAVIGNGDIVTFQATYALPGTEQLTQSLSGSFSYKHFLEGTPLIAGIPVTTGSSSGLFPTTYFPFVLGYGASIQEEDARSDLDVSLNYALRGIGTDWQKFDNARFNARSSFFYVKADASRTQDLPLGLSGYVRLGVQFADQPLISHEQYSLGGINSVRGYLESEELSDSALSGTVELRSPSFADIVDAGVDEWRVFGFYDGVAGWLRSPVAPERQAYGLEGAGIGTSLTMLGHLHGVVDLAWPLVTGTVTRAGSMRTQFRVWTDF